MYPGGNVIRVKPTVSATAYDANDVLFLGTEIPNAVSNRGGVSLLHGIAVIDQADQGKDIDLIFTQKQLDLIGAISPGSSGGISADDDAVETSNPIANVKIDFSDNQMNLINSLMTYTTGRSGAAVSSSSTMLPIMLQASGGSTSVYFSGVALEATDLAAVDDLIFIFNIQYLD